MRHPSRVFPLKSLQDVHKSDKMFFRSIESTNRFCKEFEMVKFLCLLTSCLLINQSSYAQTVGDYLGGDDTMDTCLGSDILVESDAHLTGFEINYLDYEDCVVFYAKVASLRLHIIGPPSEEWIVWGQQVYDERRQWAVCPPKESHLVWDIYIDTYGTVTCDYLFLVPL